MDLISFHLKSNWLSEAAPQWLNPGDPSDLLSLSLLITSRSSGWEPDVSTCKMGNYQRKYNKLVIVCCATKWEIKDGNIITVTPMSQCHTVTNVSPLPPPLSPLICSPQVKRLLSTLRAQVSNTDYVRKYNSTSPDHQPLGQARCQSFHPQVKWILWYLKLQIEKFIIEKQSQQCVSDLYWVLFCHQFQHHGHTFYLTHWRLRVPIPSKTLEGSC